MVDRKPTETKSVNLSDVQAADQATGVRPGRGGSAALASKKDIKDIEKMVKGAQKKD